MKKFTSPKRKATRANTQRDIDTAGAKASEFSKQFLREHPEFDVRQHPELLDDHHKEQALMRGDRHRDDDAGCRCSSCLCTRTVVVGLRGGVSVVVAVKMAPKWRIVEIAKNADGREFTDSEARLIRELWRVPPSKRKPKLSPHQKNWIIQEAPTVAQLTADL